MTESGSTGIEGTSPFVGRELRDLLTRGGFVRAEGTARAIHYGTEEEARGFGAFSGSLFGHPVAVERAVQRGLADREELARIGQAWSDWGTEPGAFAARFWCEAIAWPL